MRTVTEMDLHEIESSIEAILFASGEPVHAERIAAVLGLDADTVLETADRLADRYSFERRGIRLLKLERRLQMCSAAEYADTVRLALEKRKPPQLTQPALEVLAIAAYFQPVTRTYIEQVRGVDSSYTVGMLQERGLIEECGRLGVPGRPALFRTTDAFLRTFGLSSLNELPPLPETEQENEDGQMTLMQAISALQTEKEIEGEEET